MSFSSQGHVLYPGSLYLMTDQHKVRTKVASQLPYHNLQLPRLALRSLWHQLRPSLSLCHSPTSPTA